MNIGYLLSILDLYILKEKNGCLVIEVDNVLELVKVKFCYSFDTPNKTFVKIKKEIFFDNIEEFLKKIQGNLNIKKENISNLDNKNTYQITFDSNRKLSFVNFSNEELSLIRKNLKNIENDFSFVVENNYYKVYQENKKNNLSFSMGFTTYITLFITSILFLDIFILSLLVFKVFIN